MSAEFTMIGDGGAAAATIYGEFQLMLTLTGDAETARARLAAAIEKLGYHRHRRRTADGAAR